MDEEKSVYIVEVTGCVCSAPDSAFSDPGDASAYVKLQNDRMRAMGGDAIFRTVAVVPMDPPREAW